MALIRAKLPTPVGGNGSMAAAYPHVPPDLRRDISHILDSEGLMESSAESRILARIDKNHSETLGGIADLKDEIHSHDTRLTVVELDIKGFKDDAKIAAGERRNNGRIVKGALVASIASIVIGALMSVYGPSSRAVPEVKQDAAAISSQLKELIEVIKQDRDDRKVEAPVNTPRPTTRGHSTPRHPEPMPGPGARLRDGEIITIEKVPRSGDL